MRRIATIAVATLMMAGMSNAWGASGGDPQDTPGGLDIASNSVRTVEISKGVFKVRFAVKTYKPFDISDGSGSFFWQFDMYGDSSVDYVAFMFGDPDAVPAEPAFCLVKSRNPHVIYKAYVHVAVSDNRIVCGLPKHDLKMTKPVTWRLAGRMGDVIDRAPDSGWYGG
jgi:hypothetical protein